MVNGLRVDVLPLDNTVREDIPRLAHPGPRRTHTEERPLSRPAATASPSLCQLAKRDHLIRHKVTGIGKHSSLRVSLYMVRLQPSPDQRVLTNTSALPT
jgi:hypothetical protein